MVHLRLIVPSALAAVVHDYLLAAAGVAHVVRIPGADAHPAGEVIFCDVVREAANEVIEWLQDHDIHRDGAITIEALEAVVSDAAQLATDAAPGHAGDALIWEELESRARSESLVTTSFLVFMAIAAIIAGVGILLDAPILIVGAMVVGTDYGPLAAICIAAIRRRMTPLRVAAATLSWGLITASAATLGATVLFRLTGLAPASYDLSDRELTAFISHPDGMAAVVAVLAGVVGMLSLTEGRAGALIGVLVSVTTIPAAANIGVAAAYGEWGELGGAAVQLAVNVAGLVVAGVATLAVQARGTMTVGDGIARPS